MQTCPASMPYDNQRIRDVVDDAVELDVATKMVVGLGWERGSQHSRLPDTGDPRSKPRLAKPQPTRVCARHHRWCCLQLRYSVIGSWRWGVLVGRWSFSSGWRWSHTHSRLEQHAVSPATEDWWSSHIARPPYHTLPCELSAAGGIWRYCLLISPGAILPLRCDRMNRSKYRSIVPLL